MSNSNKDIIDSLKLFHIGESFIDNLPQAKQKKFYREWANRVKKEVTSKLQFNPFGKPKSKLAPFYIKSGKGNKKVSFYGSPVNMAVDPEYNKTFKQNIDYTLFGKGEKRPKVNIHGRWVTLKRYRNNIYNIPDTDVDNQFKRMWLVRSPSSVHGYMWGQRRDNNKLRYVASDNSVPSWVWSEYAKEILHEMYNIFEELASETLNDL